MLLSRYIELEKRYLDEHTCRLQQLRRMEQGARAKKIEIMNRAGLACSDDDPDYFMFHNPFVWMYSDHHHPWPGIDYKIASRVLEIEARIRTLRDEFYQWSRENNPWYLFSSDKTR